MNETYVIAVRMPIRGTALALSGWVTDKEDTWHPQRGNAGAFGRKLADDLAGHWRDRGFTVTLEPVTK